MKLSESSWSVEVETFGLSPSFLLVIKWDADILNCTTVMVSVLSPRQEVMSPPVRTVSGGVRLPVQFSCDVLQVRLTALVPGDINISTLT